MDINIDIDTVPIASLSYDSKNARKHTLANIEAIKGSLAAFGQQKPIVVDAEGVVIAGNGTLEAAIALGWKNILVARSKLKGAEAKAFALADNRTAELAEWDMPTLADTLKELDEAEFDLKSIGFDMPDDDDNGKETPVKESGNIAGDKNTHVDKLEKFLNREFLEIKLYYSRDEYELVTAGLDAKLEALKANGADSYSDVVKALVCEK